MNSRAPLVCVVMPGFRSADTLPAAAASVLSQRYDRLVLAVALQRGDDATVAAAQGLDDARVEIVLASTRGIAHARNAAIRAVDADYYMFLDSDDEYISADVVDAYVADIGRHPLAALRFADWVGVVDGSTRDRARIAAGWRPTYRRLLLDNFIATGTVMLPRSVLEDVGLFNESYGHAEDWDMWLRVARRYPIRRVPVLALRYRETKLLRPFPRSHFVTEMEIVRSQPASALLRMTALTTAYGRHGLYYARTLGQRRSAASLLAARPLDLFCMPAVVAYKAWRVTAGMSRVRPQYGVEEHDRRHSGYATRGPA